LTYLFAFGYLIIHASIIITVAIVFIPGSKTVSIYTDYFKMQAKNEVHVDDFFAGMSKSRLKYFQILILLMPLVFSFCNQILYNIYPAFGVKHVTGGFVFGSMSPMLVVGILVFVLGVGRTITFWHTGRVNQKFFEAFIILSPIIMTVGGIVIFFARTADILLPGFIIYGLASGYTYAIGFILLMEISRTGKGMKAGLYEGAIGASALASTLISTFIGQLEPAYPYLLSMLFSLAISIMILVARVCQRHAI